jgi:hypothetical protein
VCANDDGSSKRERCYAKASIAYENGKMILSQTMTPHNHSHSNQPTPNMQTYTALNPEVPVFVDGNLTMVPKEELFDLLKLNSAKERATFKRKTPEEPSPFANPSFFLPPPSARIEPQMELLADSFFNSQLNMDGTFKDPALEKEMEPVIKWCKWYEVNERKKLLKRKIENIPDIPEPELSNPELIGSSPFPPISAFLNNEEFSSSS